MKRYEGLFILDTAGKEEGLKEMIDKVVEQIQAVGGKVDKVQKMDKRSFARVANKKHPSGYYVNIIFDCIPEGLEKLKGAFDLDEDVFRVLFTHAHENAGASVGEAA